MKRFVKRGFLALSGVLMCAAVFTLKGQDLVVGAEYGLSQVKLHTAMGDEETANFLNNRAGISLEFSPYFSKFFVTSGASVSMTNLGKNMTIPLTFRLALGKKLRPFAELGGYYDISLNDVDDKFLPQNNFGVKSMFGVIYHIDKRWRAELAYNIRFSLNDAYKEEHLMLLNQVSLIPYRSRETGVSLRIKYRF